MSYIVYLNEFNRWLESNELSDTAQLLYFKLLDVFNRAGWPESACLSPLKVMVMARLRSASAAAAARDALREAGFLAFIDEDGGEAIRYFLTSPWENSAPESESEKDSDRGDRTEAAPENEPKIDSENRTEFCTKNCTEIDTEINTENDTVSESTNDKHNKNKKKTKNKTKTKSKNNSPLAVARGEYARAEKSEKSRRENLLAFPTCAGPPERIRTAFMLLVAIGGITRENFNLYPLYPEVLKEGRFS